MRTSHLDSQDGIQHLTIDPSRDWEVDYWTRKLEVPEVELRRAIAASGGRAVEVVHLLTAWLGCKAT